MIILWSQHPFNHIQFPDSIVYGVKVIVRCQQVLGIGVFDGPKRGEFPFQCLWIFGCPCHLIIGGVSVTVNDNKINF